MTLGGLRHLKRRPSVSAGHWARWLCASNITARRRFRGWPQNLLSTSRYPLLCFSRLRPTARLCGRSDTFTLLTLTTHSVPSSIRRLRGPTHLLCTWCRVAEREHC